MATTTTEKQPAYRLTDGAILYFILTIPWLLFFVPILFAFWWTVQGWENVYGIWRLFPIAISAFVLLAGLREVKASSPAQNAILTIWGIRFELVIFSEGYKLLAPFFPFYIDLIVFSIEMQNLDFQFPNVRCRLTPLPSEAGTSEETGGNATSEGVAEEDGETQHEADTAATQGESGGEISVDVSVSIVPDIARIDRYIIAGGITPSATPTKETATELQDIARDRVGAALRQEAARRSWTEMTFSQERTAAILVHSVVSEEPLPVGNNKWRYREFLRNLPSDGAGDVLDLGIKIRILNVVRVEPTGALKEAAERAARELQEQSAENVETQTVNRLAAMYVQASISAEGKPTISYKEALEFVRIERKKATEVFIRGSSGQFTDAAALLAFGKGNNK
jgi:hypothetical protein